MAPIYSNQQYLCPKYSPLLKINELRGSPDETMSRLDEPVKRRGKDELKKILRQIDEEFR